MWSVDARPASLVPPRPGRKLAAGAVAVATVFGGMGVASTALAADRDSYKDTVEILLSKRPVTSTV